MATASACGSATICDDAFDLSAGDRLIRSAQVSGFADPGETADAMVSTDGSVDSVGNTGDSFQIDFELLVDLGSTASADNPREALAAALLNSAILLSDYTLLPISLYNLADRYDGF